MIRKTTKQEIFLPATPGSELRRRYQKVINNANVRVSVAEIPGTNLKRRIQKSDPFKNKKCQDAAECMVCNSENSGGRCRSEGVTYEMRCNGCGEKYIGETSRNAYTRGAEHRAGLERKDRMSALHVHDLERPDGNTQGFKMRVTGVFGGDATKRQITESVLIEQSKRYKLINRCDEWRHIKLPGLELRST